MLVPEEPVRIRLFRENPVFTSLHLKSPVHVVPPQIPPWSYNSPIIYQLDQLEWSWVELRTIVVKGRTVEVKIGLLSI